MRLALFLNRLALASILPWFTNGAPPPGKREKKPQYSNEETRFIIKELESRAKAGDFSRVWKAISEAHDNKVAEKAPGFLIYRSSFSIYKHFNKIIMKSGGIVVPRIVKQMYQEKKLKKYYSPEEETFINEQLLTCEHLYSMKTWEQIEKNHEEKRKSHDPGFINKRPACGLRTHFKRFMVQHNLVDEAVKKKFQGYFTPIPASSSIEGPQNSGPNRTTEMASGSDGDKDVWCSILEELSQRSTVDEYGVDHAMFLDTRNDRHNDIFELDSPYELRTFEPMSL